MKVYAVRHVAECEGKHAVILDQLFLKKETAKRVADEMRSRLMEEDEDSDPDVFVEALEVYEE